MSLDPLPRLVPCRRYCIDSQILEVVSNLLVELSEGHDLDLSNRKGGSDRSSSGKREEIKSGTRTHSFPRFSTIVGMGSVVGDEDEPTELLETKAEKKKSVGERNEVRKKLSRLTFAKIGSTCFL